MPAQATNEKLGMETIDGKLQEVGKLWKSQFITVKLYFEPEE